MADDINITITGDSEDIKKFVKQAEGLLKRWEKSHKASTERRVKNQKKAAEQIKKSEERNAKRIAAMERRLSRKRARNRLRLMKERIRIAKREAKEEERIRKRTLKNIAKFGKLGLAGLGIGGVAGLAVAAKSIFDFDLALTRLAVDQDITRKKQAEIRAEMNKTSLALGVGRNSLFESMSRIIDKSGDIPLATQNFEDLGKLLLIKGEEFAEDFGSFLAAASGALEGNELTPIELLKKVLVLGKEGSIPIQEMADKMQELAGSWRAIGNEDPTQFFAVLQRLGTRVGTEKAITSLTLFFDDILKMNAQLRKTGKEQLKIFDGDELKSELEIIEALLSHTGGIKNNLLALPGVTQNITRVFDVFALEAKNNNGQLRETKALIESAADVTTVLEERYGRVRDTGAIALNRLKALALQLFEGAAGDTLTVAIERLNEFLSDQTNLDKLLHTFQQIGKTLGVIFGFLQQITGTTIDPETGEFKSQQAEAEKRLNALLTDQFRGERNRLIREARAAGDVGTPAFGRELRRLTNQFFIENNLTLDEKGKITQQQTSVSDQANPDVGENFVNVVNRSGTGG